MRKRVPDAAGLQRITAAYLEHRTTTAAHLARLLRMRIRRCDDYDPASAERYEDLVRAEIARLVSAGLLDDAEYAASRTRSLRRRGASARKIRAALGAKGLDGEVVDEALAPDPDRGEVDPELEAARTWARKHRVGPWRGGPADPETRKRELARLARKGFSYGVALRVLDEVPDDVTDDG